MIESQQRVEDFKAEIAGMKLKDPATARDRQLLVLSIVLMIAAIVIEVVAYIYSYNTENPLEQNDATVLAIGGAVGAVVGAALFVRYSLAQFMRYWLARVTYEQSASTDRIVEAVSKS